MGLNSTATDHHWSGLLLQSMIQVWELLLSPTPMLGIIVGMNTNAGGYFCSHLHKCLRLWEHQCWGLLLQALTPVLGVSIILCNPLEVLKAALEAFYNFQVYQHYLKGSHFIPLLKLACFFILHSVSLWKRASLWQNRLYCKTWFPK